MMTQKTQNKRLRQFGRVECEDDAEWMKDCNNGGRRNLDRGKMVGSIKEIRTFFAVPRGCTAQV